MAHAATRIAKGRIPQFCQFMESVGFTPGEVGVGVWTITIAELAAGTAVLIGWFVGEHGTGGRKYGVALIIILLVLAAADRRNALVNQRPSGQG